MFQWFRFHQCYFSMCFFNVISLKEGWEANTCIPIPLQRQKLVCIPNPGVIYITKTKLWEYSYWFFNLTQITFFGHPPFWPKPLDRVLNSFTHLEFSSQLPFLKSTLPFLKLINLTPKTSSCTLALSQVALK